MRVNKISYSDASLPNLDEKQVLTIVFSVAKESKMVTKHFDWTRNSQNETKHVPHAPVRQIVVIHTSYLNSFA